MQYTLKSERLLLVLTRRCIQRIQKQFTSHGEILS